MEVVGIKEAYNKNFHIKCIEYYEKFDSLHIVLRYKDGDIRDMLVSNYGLVEIVVLNFVIPVTCTYGEPLCDEVGAQFYLLTVFLTSGGRGRAMVFSYQSIPLEACA